jgi:sulfotransferase famil protein
VSVEQSGAPATTGPTDPADRARRYADARTIVLFEHKLLYLPVPKAGCTSILWLLADIAGIDRSRFHRSTVAEVTLPMTVHDLWHWEQEGRRLNSLSAEQRDEALTGDGWLRFTVVREPASRVWSAWQSKLLMREPRYVSFFGDEPWFPRPPDANAPEQIVDDFCSFITALPARWHDPAVRDPHWTAQYDIVDSLPLTHVGHLDKLGDTMDVLRAHLGDRPELASDLPRENRMPLAWDPVVLDASGADALRELYGEDFRRFDYVAPDAENDPVARAAWAKAAAASFPLIDEVVARHERLGALADVVNDRNEKIRQRDEKLAKARDERRAMRATIEAERKRVDKLTANLEAERAKRAAVESERDDVSGRLSAVLASSSWRVTRPMRAVGRWVRRRPKA